MSKIIIKKLFKNEYQPFKLIILKDKGNVLNDQTKGDVKIHIKILNKSEFKRSGLNLILEKEITLKESLTGFDIEFTHLNGKTYCIKNDEGDIIKPEYQKNITNFGMIRNDTTGNLIIKFRVKFPDKLTVNQVSELKEIL